MPTAKKTIKLPPKPVARPKPSAAPVTKPKDPANISDLKAIDYAITLEDGSVLRAKGEHADLIYRYLMQCERFCAERQLVNFLAPSFARYAADGTVLAQGGSLDDMRVR